MPTTSNFGWTTPADTDLVKDGAAAIRTLGNGIDASLLDLKGGASGQILSKASNTDLDYTWINNDQGDITEVQAGTGISIASGTGPIPVITNTATTTIDAEGDLLVGDAADAVQRLAIGSNGNVLTVDTSVDGKIKWAAPSSGALTLLSTTTLSGADTTISGISGSYKSLMVLVLGINPSTNAQVNCQPNGSASICDSITNNAVNNGTAATGFINDAIYFGGGQNFATGNTENAYTLIIDNYADTSFRKAFHFAGGNKTSAATTNGAVNGAGIIKTTSAITSLKFAIASGTFSGTVLTYGVS